MSRRFHRDFLWYIQWISIDDVSQGLPIPIVDPWNSILFPPPSPSPPSSASSTCWSVHEPLRVTMPAPVVAVFPRDLSAYMVAAKSSADAPLNSLMVHRQQDVGTQLARRRQR